MGANAVGFLTIQREYVLLSLTIVIILYKNGTWFPEMKAKSNIKQLWPLLNLFYLFYKKLMQVSSFLFKYAQTNSCTVPIIIAIAIT